MSEYEYRTEKLATLRDSKKLAKLVTKLGEQGWELYDKQDGGIIFGRARVVFRRPRSTPARVAPEPRVAAGDARAANDLESVESAFASGQIDEDEYLRRRRVLGV